MLGIITATQGLESFIVSCSCEKLSTNSLGDTNVRAYFYA